MNRIRGLSWIAAGVLVAGCAAACSDRGAAPDANVLAAVGARRVTLGDWEAYLARNVPEGLLQKADSALLSRLFDTLVEEELWLAEADRLGIEVSEADVDRALERAAVAGRAPDRDARRWFARDLRIQRAREALLGSIADVGEEEVRAYARAHLASLLPPTYRLVRTLSFGNRREALEVRREILERRMPFERAVYIFGVRPEENEPVELDLADAPPEVRAAVERLRAGQISRPVTYRDRVYLFLVEATPADVHAGHPWALDRAREALLEARLREAAAHVLHELRETIGVRVHADALPFAYVAPGSAGASAATMQASPTQRRSPQ